MIVDAYSVIRVHENHEESCNSASVVSANYSFVGLGHSVKQNTISGLHCGYGAPGFPWAMSISAEQPGTAGGTWHGVRERALQRCARL